MNKYVEIANSRLGLNSADIRVLSVHPTPNVAVYNLEIEGEHEFFGSGILLHNCDCLRYMTDTLFSYKKQTIRNNDRRDPIKIEGLPV